MDVKVEAAVQRLETAGYRVYPRKNAPCLEIQAKAGRPLMDIYYDNSRDFELSVTYLLAEARAFNDGTHKIVDKTRAYQF